MRNLIAGIIGFLIWYLMFSFVVMEFPLHFAEHSQGDRAMFIWFGVCASLFTVCVYNGFRGPR